MIIRAPRPSNNFYLLDKHISEDLRLSWAGRGLLIYLLGKPDGWQVQVEHLIRQTSASKKPTGRDGVYALLEELRGAGYVERLQNRVSGKFKGFDYLVHETPQIQSNEPQQDQPETVDPFPADPTQVSIDGTSNIKNTTTPPTPQQQPEPSLPAGGGEIDIDDDTKDYILLVLRKDSKKATHPGRYVRGALKRIKSQGGLSSADREDLEAARSEEKQMQQYAALKKPSPREAVASPIWEMAKQKLANIFLEADYRLWIEPLVCLKDNDEQRELILAGTDPYFATWVRDNYMAHIAAALPGRSVQVI